MIQYTIALGHQFDCGIFQVNEKTYNQRWFDLAVWQVILYDTISMPCWERKQNFTCF